MGPAGHEAFGRKGPAGRWPSGPSPSDRKARRWKGRWAGKPFGGTVRGVAAFGRSAQRIGMPIDGKVHGPGSPRVKRFGGGAIFGSRFPTSRDTRRRKGPPDRVAFEPKVRWDGGLRITGSTDGTPENGSVQEASGGLFGARCKDSASRHLASPPISACEMSMTCERRALAPLADACLNNEEGPALRPPPRRISRRAHRQEGPASVHLARR